MTKTVQIKINSVALWMNWWCHSEKIFLGAKKQFQKHETFSVLWNNFWHHINAVAHIKILLSDDFGGSDQQLTMAPFREPFFGVEKL